MQIHDRLRNMQCAVHNVPRVKRLNDWLIVNTSSLYNDDVQKIHTLLKYQSYNSAINT